MVGGEAAKRVRPFKEILVAKIDNHMDEAFNTEYKEKRQKYRNVIH